MSIADAHRAPGGAVEPFATVTGAYFYNSNAPILDTLSGPVQLGGHFGLGHDLDLTARIGGTTTSQELGLQLAGPAFTQKDITLDWMAGLGTALERGTDPCGDRALMSPCAPNEHNGETYAYLSFAPNAGLRFGWKLAPSVSLVGLFRLSYSRTVHVVALSGVPDDWGAWVETMGGVSWSPLPLLRLGLGLGTLNSFRYFGVPALEGSGSVSWQF